MSRTASRRARIREIISRAIPKLVDVDQFTTHEMFEVIHEMTPKELVGIDKAKSVIKHLKRPDTLGIYLRGHPSISKHQEPLVNLLRGSKTGKRLRSAQWRLKGD